MRPMIIPLAAFRLFDAAVTRRRVRFSDNKVFAEFSSLVEAIILSEAIRFFNVGSSILEWNSGTFLPGEKLSHNPFEPFHGIDFIKETPCDFMGKGKKVISMISQKEWELVFDQEFVEEPHHAFTLWTYFSAYTQAYNGDFGPVTIKEYPLIKNLLDHVLLFQGSKVPIYRDPFIFQSYEKLKTKYEEMLKGVFEISITPIIIPPITAILLSRLPDGVNDPYIVVHEIMNLREELEPVRRRFSTLEETLYSDDTTIDDWRGAQSALEADAKIFAKKFHSPFYDNAFVRWFVDNASFLGKLLIKRSVEKEEIIAFLAKLIPTFGERISVAAPSLLSDMAIKTKNIKGYGNLVQKKLGLTLEK